MPVSISGADWYLFPGKVVFNPTPSGGAAIDVLESVALDYRNLDNSTTTVRDARSPYPVISAPVATDEGFAPDVLLLGPSNRVIYAGSVANFIQTSETPEIYARAVAAEARALAAETRAISAETAAAAAQAAVADYIADNPPGGDGGTPPDATNTVKGLIRLTNDLGGSAIAPTVPGLASKADRPSGGTDGQALVRSGTTTAWATVSGGGAVPDASTTVKGLVQLAGDLAGTATAPTVPGLAGKANYPTGGTDGAALVKSGTGTAWGAGGTYIKPTAGIPDSDLTADSATALAGVKAKLDLATVGADSDVLTYDVDTGKYKPVAAASVELPTYVPRMVVLNTGQAIPADFPAGGIVLRRSTSGGGGAAVAMGKQAGTNVSSLVLPATTEAIAVGDYLLVCCGSSYDAGTDVTHAITFSAGAASMARIANKVQGTAAQLDFMFGKCTTAIPVGTVITDTASAVRLDMVCKAIKIPGLVGSSAVDQTATGGAGSTIAPSIGPTATTGQANEVAIAGYVWNPMAGPGPSPLTFTPPTGYTAVGTAATSSTAPSDVGPRQLDVAVKVLAATGAQTALAAFTRASGDTTSASSFAGVLATFKLV